MSLALTHEWGAINRKHIPCWIVNTLEAKKAYPGEFSDTNCFDKISKAYASITSSSKCYDVKMIVCICLLWFGSSQGFCGQVFDPEEQCQWKDDGLIAKKTGLMLLCKQLWQKIGSLDTRHWICTCEADPWENWFQPVCLRVKANMASWPVWRPHQWLPCLNIVRHLLQWHLRWPKKKLPVTSCRMTSPSEVTPRAQITDCFWRCCLGLRDPQKRMHCQCACCMHCSNALHVCRMHVCWECLSPYFEFILVCVFLAQE